MFLVSKLNRVGYGLMKRSFVGRKTSTSLSFLRQYHSYRLLILPPQIKPLTNEEAALSVIRDFELAEKVDFFTETPPDCLGIILSTEFSRNGRLVGGRPTFDAQSPIAASIYQSILKQAQLSLQKIPAGHIYLPGTFAVDTGMMEGQQKVGQNIGFVGMGKNGIICEFSKRSQSTVDGWTSDYVVKPGTGSQMITIPDTTGDGRSVNAIITICLDQADLTQGTFKWPRPVDLVISPCAGAPSSHAIKYVPPKGVAFAVADTLDYDHFFPGIRNEEDFVREPVTGLYEEMVVEEKPWLPGFSTVIWQKRSVASLLQASLSLIGITPQKYQEAQVKVLNTIGTKDVPGTAGRKVVFVSSPFPLSIEKPDQQNGQSSSGNGTMTTDKEELSLVTSPATLLTHSSLPTNSDITDKDEATIVVHLASNASSTQQQSPVDSKKDK